MAHLVERTFAGRSLRPLSIPCTGKPMRSIPATPTIAGNGRFQTVCSYRAIRKSGQLSNRHDGLSSGACRDAPLERSERKSAVDRYAGTGHISGVIADNIGHQSCDLVRLSYPL